MNQTTPEKIGSLINAWVEPTVSEWYRRQCANHSAAFYLYFQKPTEDHHGDIAIETDLPGVDWELVTPERIGLSWTKDKVKQWAREHCRRLPILNPDLLDQRVQCCERDHNFDGNCHLHPKGVTDEAKRKDALL